MKIKLFLILVLVFILNNYQTSGQVKTNNTNTSTKPEIDRLAEKYKDMSNIILYTANGELEGVVKVEYNSGNKPQAVNIMVDNETNIAAICEFLKELISEKKKKGYKEIHNYIGEEFSLEIGFSASDGISYTYKKGNMYFVIKGGEERYNVSLGNQTYWFTIETGDNSRKGSNKASNFEF